MVTDEELSREIKNIIESLKRTTDSLPIESFIGNYQIVGSKNKNLMIITVKELY